MEWYEYGFEKLLVWRKSKDLVGIVYQATRSFPKEELFGITNQMRRAAVSVASNIAEGSTRQTTKDRGHFSVMAFSSLVELVNQLCISKDLGFLKDSEYVEIRKKCSELSKLLHAYRKGIMGDQHH